MLKLLLKVVGSNRGTHKALLLCASKHKAGGGSPMSEKDFPVSEVPLDMQSGFL